MKLQDLKNILYSRRRGVQFAILYDRAKNADIDTGTIDYIVKTYGEKEVQHIEAFENQLLITI